MESLVELKISNCPKLDTFPEINGDMHSLTELTIESTGLRELPSSIGNLSVLTKLNLGGCEDLVTLPNSVCNLKNLKCLYLRGCKKLEKLLISCLPKDLVQFCQNLNELPGELPPNLEELSADYHLALKSIIDLVIKCLKLCILHISWFGDEISEYGTVSTCQVNELKFIQHFLRRCIQCDFHQRDYFLISFPEVNILELFDYQFVNQKVISIDLNPSWYTHKFMGFSICYTSDLPPFLGLVLEVSLVARLRKHSLKWDIYRNHSDFPSAVNFMYIPFKTLWHASDNKEGKNPNDYYLFEVSIEYSENTCWGIRLEYENKDRRWGRKQQATQNPELFPIPQKDDVVTTEIGCSMVPEQPAASLASSSSATAEDNIAADRGLHLGNENKNLEVDQAAMAVQKELESQNAELTRVCDSPERKMGDASRKRKRKRKR